MTEEKDYFIEGRFQECYLEEKIDSKYSEVSNLKTVLWPEVNPDLDPATVFLQDMKLF